MKHKHLKSGEANIGLTIVIVLILLLGSLTVSWAGGMGVLSMFAKNFMGAASGFNGSNCGSTGSVSCPSGTLASLSKDAATIARINKNMDFYKQVADASNIPWEVVAATQFRESTNSTDRTRSWSNGDRPLCNGTDHTYDNFKAKFGHECQTALDDALGAMDHLQGKVSHRFKKDVWDETLIKKAFLGFNGDGGGRYLEQARALGFAQAYEGSPYVMSNFDERRKQKNMKKCCNNGCKRYDFCEQQDGAFTVASLLHNAEFDASGKIVSLGGCKASGSATPTTACTDADSSVAGAAGAVIPGQFYPPYGDKMKTIQSINDSAHTVGAGGHGVFNALSGYRDVGDGAIDYNVKRSAMTPIYATFDGKVVATKDRYYSDNYGPHGGYGGGIIYLVSTDKQNSAIFAHIGFVSGLAPGREVKKGDQIGFVAPPCGHSVKQCNVFNGPDHLHYQLYINKVGQNKSQLLTLFPYK